MTDAKGRVSFTTILPGCYAGRWLHVHVEVFKDIATATTGSASGVISQLALPGAAMAGFYASDARYGASVENHATLSVTRDGIFADNTAAQMTGQTLTPGGDAAGLMVGAVVGAVVGVSD